MNGRTNGKPSFLAKYLGASLLTLALPIAAAQAQDAAAQGTVITGARMLDVLTGKMID
ncbi:MAG: hypothetical protein RIS11_641, partial [Pseudomonadota bacterium]